MTTPPGGWTQLYDQDAVAWGYLPKEEWAAGVDTTPPNGGQYSILNLIDGFKVPLRDFQFIIDWPDDGDSFVRWEQSESPFSGRGTVNILDQSPGGQEGCGAGFGGLAADGDVSSTMDGNTSGCWWWAIGTSAPYNAGIPAYGASDASSLTATRTRLWVR
jgi:hypothetical protein